MNSPTEFVIRIICDQHRRPRFVTRFQLSAHGWREWIGTEDARKKRATPQQGVQFEEINYTRTGQRVTLVDNVPLSGRDQVMQEFDAASDKLDRLSAKFSGEPVPEPTMPPTRDVFPNRCDRCGANLPRRQEKMFPLLDLLRGADHSTVTLRELAAIARHHDTPEP